MNPLILTFADDARDSTRKKSRREKKRERVKAEKDSVKERKIKKVKRERTAVEDDSSNEKPEEIALENGLNVNLLKIGSGRKPDLNERVRSLIGTYY